MHFESDNAKYYFNQTLNSILQKEESMNPHVFTHPNKIELLKGNNEHLL